MSAIPRDELHRLIDTLSDEDAASLVAALRRRMHAAKPASRALRHDDIVLVAPIMPDGESADEMIETIQRWRREAGDV